ncbi:MAG: NADH:ubiquinone oxidoreductase [Nitrospirae bacterium]|nr:NADH:ubiquinone oxidoreductase [Nitrospirota bacterium]
MTVRAGVFAFTSCEGCSLITLEVEDRLLEILGRVEFVNFREAIDDKSDDYDIAFIDGAITREHEVGELMKIRERAAILVAMGACAVQGGLYFLKEYHEPGETLAYVYGDKAGQFDTMPVRPVSQYVKVDHSLYGCPIDKREFVEVVTALLSGRRPNIPDYPVCNECRMSENICVFERGLACMGPVTRAGCGAICPSRHVGCFGCRGMVDKPALDQHRAVLTERGLTEEEITARYRMFNGHWGSAHEKP